MKSQANEFPGQGGRAISTESKISGSEIQDETSQNQVSDPFPLDYSGLMEDAGLEEPAFSGSKYSFRALDSDEEFYVVDHMLEDPDCIENGKRFQVGRREDRFGHTGEYFATREKAFEYLVEDMLGMELEDYLEN